ncbi:MAG: glycosyltransferase [Peptococcaceae bacterium]|jgi:processive 1,2-diacylglycerol beta-glucosyltransferase|nr:galactosyldiacylglycerol synthase [Peptococcaceae bacterium]MDH7526202.1 glycosyltransferase [Peptococcaceae bacterium]
MVRPSSPVKVLIFSVSIGSGHDSVAKALAERLLEEVPGSTAEIVDTFQYINSVLHKVVFGSYIETLKFTPRVWGYLYEQAENGERLVDLGQILSKVLSTKLEHLLRNFNPDVILTSHAFPTGILSVLKERGQVKVPLAAAVTDFHVHSFWIHQGVDRYFLGAPDLAYNLLKHGIKAEKIKATGIPIRSQFGREFNIEEAKKQLGLDSQPAVLVAGGGLGMGKIDSIARELLNNASFHVVVVAGKNRRLYEALAGLDQPRLKVFGFVENMAEVIAACDLVISKPGGVTTAEVLAMRKPLVIYSSLPGQEDRNTDYLLNRGAAVKVRKLDMLVPEIMSLWSNPLRRRHMLEMTGQLGAPHASRLVWEEMWSLL